MIRAQNPRPPAVPADPREEFSRFHQSDLSGMSDQRVPGYGLHLKLGRGGMGSIYLATDQEGRQVALKLVPRFKEGHPHHHLMEWFTRECAATLALSHPNVVSSFSAGRTSNYLYLSLEILDGGTLFENLKSWGRLAWTQAKPVMLDIARGLHAAHEAGIIHRDVKPENFMQVMTPDGLRTKAIDFGLCHIEGYEDIYAPMFDLPLPFAPALSVVGADVGTREYRAPEYADPELSHRRTFDVYPAGLILYELLCGKLPFDLKPDLDVEHSILYYGHLHRNVSFPRPSEMVFGLGAPKGAEDIVMCALEKDPKNRFQTMEEMARAIEAVA